MKDLAPGNARLVEAYAACEASLRQRDRDLWLAALFAPQRARAHLHALHAFGCEMARVRDVISDPLPGEIRLQWWTEVLQGERSDESASHPIAIALLDTLARCGLPAQPLLSLVEARRFDLYDDQMPSLNDLEGWCGETFGVPLRLASLILAGGRDPGGADAAGLAGVALGLTQVLRALPLHLSRGQCYLPTDLLAEHRVTRADLSARRMTPAIGNLLTAMRAHARKRMAEALVAIRAMEAPARAALLPLAVVEPSLRAMEKRPHDPLNALVEAPQWRRQWAMWRLARAL